MLQNSQNLTRAKYQEDYIPLNLILNSAHSQVALPTTDVFIGQTVKLVHNSDCTATIKAFTLVLCGLPLWLLVSMEVGKFDHYHGYLSSESPTPDGLPKHLDIMVSKANGLRVGVLHYHLSLHNKLEQMDTVIYRFIGFSFSVYSIHSHSNQSPQWNIFTFLSLCISHVLMEKIFRFQLRHHTCLSLHCYNYIIVPH